MVANVLAAYVGNASTDNRAAGKIKLVRGAVNGIVFHRGGDVESGLLEAKTHTSRPCKKVHADEFIAVDAHLEKIMVTHVLSDMSKTILWRTQEPIKLS